MAVGTLALAALLGGCAETTAPGAQALALDVPGAIAHGGMRSPRAAAMALASLEGAPEPMLARLRETFAGEAARREIVLSDAAGARYVLRGYLDAYPSGEGGTSVRYVWDVFDAARQRSRRIDDGFEIPAAGADPWAGIDDAALRGIAARSADAIAAFLSGTPEAVAGATVAAPPAVN